MDKNTTGGGMRDALGPAATADELSDLPCMRALPGLECLRRCLNDGAGDDEVDRVIVAIYRGMLEESSAALSLVRNGLGNAAAAHVRTLLEAYVDLVNLSADPGYLRYLNLEVAKGEKRKLESAQCRNPYLSGLLSLPDFEEQLLAARAAVDALKDADLKTEERFRKAGLSAEYYAVFGRLSEDAHLGLAALGRRYIAKSGDEGFVFAFWPETNGAKFDAEMQTCIDAVSRASVAVHSHFLTGLEGEFPVQFVE